ncbi:MAG: hypothetical protein M3069_12405 [Chloroflexota bacterium]|nr:hypothetical protein [Chloroflexota bacterium]
MEPRPRPTFARNATLERLILVGVTDARARSLVLVATALSIALDRGTWMVSESHLSTDQIQDKIDEAPRRLEEHT